MELDTPPVVHVDPEVHREITSETIRKVPWTGDEIFEELEKGVITGGEFPGHGIWACVEGVLVVQTPKPTDGTGSCKVSQCFQQRDSNILYDHG